ncbi:MAG TPA: hypothetical protein VF516_43970 [Kofleriaceae bacterium]
MGRHFPAAPAADTLKELFECLAIVERAAYRDPDPAAGPAFERILYLVKRASFGNDDHRVMLAQLVARYESVHGVGRVAPDPEVDK